MNGAIRIESYLSSVPEESDDWYFDYEVALLDAANSSDEHPLTILKGLLRQLLPPSVPLEFFLTQKYQMCQPINVGLDPWFAQTMRSAEDLLDYMNYWVIAYSNLVINGAFSAKSTGLLRDHKIRPFSSIAEVSEFLAAN